MNINKQGIYTVSNNLYNANVSSSGLMENRAINIYYNNKIGDCDFQTGYYSPVAGSTNQCMTLGTINLQKYKPGVTNFNGYKFKIDIILSWSGYNSGDTWFQGTVNGSWSSGTNWFTNSLNNYKSITGAINGMASGSYHYCTDVTIQSSNTHQFAIGLRTDNGNAGLFYQMNFLKVIPYEFSNNSISQYGYSVANTFQEI